MGIVSTFCAAGQVPPSDDGDPFDGAGRRGGAAASLMTHRGSRAKSQQREDSMPTSAP